jgi:hypothetical protein
MSARSSSKVRALLAKIQHANFCLFALVLLACVPALLALRIQVKHWVNIPIWDEWDTPGTVLCRLAEHQLNWSDLFAQHNESRKFFPRLIYIALTSALGWDVRHGMVMTFLSMSIASAFVFRYLQQGAGILNRQVLFPWFLVNLLLFAPSEYENLLCGNAFEILIPALCLFGCVTMNLSQRSIWQKVGVNSLLSFIATYTFAHGMILWPLALPIPRHAERPRANRTRSLGMAYLTYVALGAAAITCYFINYRRPDIAPPAAKLCQIGQILEFLVVWLGAPVRSPFLSVHVAGVTVGSALVAAIALSSLFLYRNRDAWKNYYPWFALAALCLASGTATAIGRLNLGLDAVFETGFNGVSSVRYHLTSVFAYVAAIGLLSRLYRDWFQSSQRWRARSLISATILTTLLSVAWIYLLSAEWTRLHRFQENRRRARTAVIWSTALPDNPDIFFAYPYPLGFSERVEKMKRLHLLKVPDVSDRVLQKIASVPQPGEILSGYIDSGRIESGDRLRIAGWARNPEQNRPADYVVLGWEEGDNSFHPFTAISTGRTREDVAQVFKTPLIRNAGFDQQINVSKLPRRPLVLRAWSIDITRQQVFPMGGIMRLELPRHQEP